jgi:hypothetical protein
MVAQVAKPSTTKGTKVHEGKSTKEEFRFNAH